MPNADARSRITTAPMTRRARTTGALVTIGVPDPVTLGWAGLGWAGLGWAGLGWAGLGWAGLGWAGLGCPRLNGDRR
ncbi:hypothetical protein Afil01_52240 [Actinorhabdospora filicis]|uniref:Uncharacterized protein n=1 Tax=Actinorhabdospora filicis TaxID=1785913 RepID=A0A9W6SRA3_9ACTN|nr:hypothetical protein Afil01_52240 [Actinorhabdospora filicis]